MVDENNNNPLSGLVSDPDSGDAPWSLEATQQNLLKHLRLYVSKYATSDTVALKRIAVTTSKLLDSSITEQSILEKLKSEESKLSKESDKILKNISKGIIKGNSIDLSRLDALSELSNKVGRDFSDKVRGVSSTFSDFHGDMGNLTKGLAKHIPIIGGMLGAFVGVVEKNKSTWQELSNVGQSFGNDMFEMGIKLHESGMGYDNAAKFLTKFSNITSRIGSSDMLDLQRQVRMTTKQFGNYGMTVDQVASFTGSLMEQQMRQGTFDKLDKNKQAQQTADYMKTLKTLARLTGRQVEEIDREIRERSKSVTIEQSRQMAMKNGIGAEEFDKKMSAINEVVATMPEEFRTKFAEMSALDIAGGVPVDAMAKNLKSLDDDYFKALQQLRQANTSKEIKAAKNALQAAASTMGERHKNLQAMGVYLDGDMKETIDMSSKMSMHYRTIEAGQAKTAKEAAKQQDAISKELSKKTTTTAYIESQENMAFATGKARAKMEELMSTGLAPLTTAMNGLAGIINSITDFFTGFNEKVIGFAEKIGIGSEGLSMLRTGLDAVSNNFMLLLGGLILFKPVIGGIVKAGWGLVKFFGGMGIKLASKLFSGIAGASKITGKLGKIAVKESAETIAKTGGKAAVKIGGKAAAKIGGKSLAKSLLKKLPGIGLIAGLGFAAGRLMDGDALGALGEVASGLVSIVPGLGTAASIAIDAALAARDVANANNEAAEVTKDVATTVSKVTSANKTDVDVNKVAKPIDTINALDKTLDNRLKLHMDAQKAQLDNITKTQTINTVTDELLVKVVNALDVSNQILIETALETKNIARSAKRSEPNALGINHSV